MVKITGTPGPRLCDETCPIPHSWHSVGGAGPVSREEAPSSRENLKVRVKARLIGGFKLSETDLVGCQGQDRKAEDRQLGKKLLAYDASQGSGGSKAHSGAGSDILWP